MNEDVPNGIEKLIKIGLNVNKKYSIFDAKFGVVEEYLIHWAIRNEHLDLVRMLVKI